MLQGDIIYYDSCHCEESSTKQSQAMIEIAAPSERSRNDMVA